MTADRFTEKIGLGRDTPINQQQECDERSHHTIGKISMKQLELKHLAKLPVVLVATLSFVGCTTPEQRELAALHELLEISEGTEFPACVAEHAGDGGSINAKDPTHIQKIAASLPTPMCRWPTARTGETLGLKQYLPC